MNAIRSTRALNKLELENAVAPSASWHADYRDTAYVYIGGLPLDLTEGDVVAIFSQYGNPTHLNLVRDRETGKSRGFAFLKYEDQRSCDLAVDNLGGAEVLGRMLRVDHSRYKKKEGEDEDTWRVDRLEAEGAARGAEDTGDEGQTQSESERRQKRRKGLLKEERELEAMLAITQDGEEQDPMRDYLIQEKRDEVQRARERTTRKDEGHRHRHHKREHRRERHKDRDRNPPEERGDSRSKARRDDDQDEDPDRRRPRPWRYRNESETRGEEKKDTSRSNRDRDGRRDDNGDGGANGERKSRRHRSRSPDGERDRDRRHRDRDRDRVRDHRDGSPDDYDEDRRRRRRSSPRDRERGDRDID